MDDLLAARFPAIARDAGGFERYHVKAAHPNEPKAVWIRHAVHKPVNCSVADLGLEVKVPTGPSLSLRAPARAVYELGMRERDHGMEIQPHPDG